ncbi:MAG: hypothetical protein KAS77_03040, partial [Thermoplasmata archaeon]|nr:hypothetical protein [Thermoplasmata archaeon]
MTGFEEDRPTVADCSDGSTGQTRPEIIKRKSDHVDICLRDDIVNSKNFWDGVQLIHCALPEVDIEAVDTTSQLFVKKVGAPSVIAAVTGGHSHGQE